MRTRHLPAALPRLALLLTLLFTACIGLIRAQPYDDSELRAFLTPPEGCPVPCFMGIRPGVTTVHEAVAILEAHEWVEEISFPGSDSIVWRWNDLAPDMLDRNSGNAAGHIRLNENNTVAVLAIPTRILFGDIWLILGKPQMLESNTLSIEGVDYTRSQRCVGYPPFYWHTPIEITEWDYSQFGGMGVGGGPGCIWE